VSSLCDTADEIHHVQLFDKQNQPHIVADKLRQFVNLSAEANDNLPHKVCHNCVVNLDFCIQFVDRCRRVFDMLQNGADQDYI
jgi:hypothetical protein